MSMPHPKHVGRRVRINLPGEAEHGRVGQIVQSMQDNYVVALGGLLITLAPESLTPVVPAPGWVDDPEAL